MRGETFYSLLVTGNYLLVTRYFLLVTCRFLRVPFYSLLIGTYWVRITFYSYSIALYSKCSHYIIRQFLKKKIQALMDAFLWSVDFAWYDVDFIVFRLDFQIMSKIVQKYLQNNMFNEIPLCWLLFASLCYYLFLFNIWSTDILTFDSKDGRIVNWIFV